VGLYSRVIFPRLCDLVLNMPFVAKLRQGLLVRAYGDVLEIGFGTGLNLPHYPKQVRKITTADPNVGMHKLAQKRVKKADIEVDQRVCSGERLPFEDCTFDCAISTFTLCTIEDVVQALGEIHRVIKSGSQFLFLEHGLSPEPHVQKWQRRLNGLEMRLADGCHLDRNIKELVVAQPFAAVEIEEFYMTKVVKTHGYMYQGIATK
jgi:SAM-dependent methyltransferase